MNNNLRIGSSLDDFLEDEGILEEINLIAIKRVIAWQIKHAMEEKKLTKSDMAKQMKTSRSSLDRLVVFWLFLTKIIFTYIIIKVYQQK